MGAIDRLISDNKKSARRQNTDSSRRHGWFTALGAPGLVIGSALGLTLTTISPSGIVQAETYARPLRPDELSPEQRKMVEQIEALATPLEEEKLFWHYGKEAPCNALIENGSYTGPIFEKYSRLSEKGGAVAGHGIYVAGNAHSSMNYYKGGGVEVALAPGTRILDTTDSDTFKKLNELGITSSDIYNLPIDVTVRYDNKSDWYVIKGSTGVSFRPYSIESIAKDPSNLLRTAAAAPFELQQQFETFIRTYIRNRPLTTETLVQIALHNPSTGIKDMRKEDARRIYQPLIGMDIPPNSLVKIFTAFHGRLAPWGVPPESPEGALRPVIDGAPVPPHEKMNRIIFAALDPGTNEIKLGAAIATLNEAERVTLEKYAIDAFEQVADEWTLRLSARTERALARVGSFLRAPQARKSVTAAPGKPDALLTAYRAAAKARGNQNYSQLIFPRITTNPAAALCRSGLEHTLSVLRGPVGLVSAFGASGTALFGLIRHVDNIYRQNQTYFGYHCRENGGNWTPLYDPDRKVYGDCLCSGQTRPVRIHIGNLTVPGIACGRSNETSIEPAAPNDPQSDDPQPTDP